MISSSKNPSTGPTRPSSRISVTCLQAFKRLIPTTIVAGSLFGLSVTPSVAVVANSQKPLPCTASMSIPRPQQHSTTDVLVTTTAKSSVTAVAHYKSKDTTHAAAASTHGKASVPFLISTATAGFAVRVTVSVALGSRKGSCSTSFTPTK